MKQRITEIEIECRETFIIRPPVNDIRPFCSECGAVGAALMISPAEAGALYGVSLREVFRLIEANAIHFAEMSDKTIYVCARFFAPEKTNIFVPVFEEL